MLPSLWRVIITELNEDINAAATQLDILNAEQVRMQTELDGKMSLKAIEETAIGEYGMGQTGRFSSQLRAGDEGK